MILKDENMILS